MSTGDPGEGRLRRPDSGPAAGPLDEQLYDLVEQHFRSTVERNPVIGTYLGLHDGDGRLGDGSRDAVEEEIRAERAHLAAIGRLDPAGLSEEARFERDLEEHNVRRNLFDLEVHRVWERRSTAIDAVGDAIFPLFVRDFAPLPDRLARIGERIAAVPAHLAEHRSRARGSQVRPWQELEVEAAADLPDLLDEVVAAGRPVLAAAAQERLERDVTAAKAAIGEHARWVRDSMAGGTDDWSLGPDRLSELIELRGFGLDAAEIEAIGEERLAHHKAGRVDAARRIDPSAGEATVMERLRSDHPATFEEALDAYRDAMLRARDFIRERGILTLPEGERCEVIATPEYLRNVLPFAAYFSPAPFEAKGEGIYVVTPGQAGDAEAMKIHWWASIVNTSVHEAYPGHHVQLTIGARVPSLTRILTSAPEMSEGWGMYCEQMMLEEGFENTPATWAAVHTDAIWRAVRILLDIRMHRDGLGIDEGVRFLADQTGFGIPEARAEVRRYTYTPTYQLSYLLGKVQILALRADQERRLGERFSLRAFHDTFLAGGELPLSFQRRRFEAAAGAHGAAGAPGSTGG